MALTENIPLDVPEKQWCEFSKVIKFLIKFAEISKKILSKENYSVEKYIGEL